MAKSASPGMADVVRNFGDRLRQGGQLHAHQKKALTDLVQCRTAALGGHVDACDSCGNIRISYNSCRNRHCPRCQSLEREAWILAREQDLLPVVYFHVVFTLPEQVNALALNNPRFVYDTLFETAWLTLRAFAGDEKWLGARTGSTMVLHTWGQNLSLHPHVHAIVPGGGLGRDGRWVAVRASPGQKFLFPVKAMSKVFRGLFMHRLCAALEAGLLAGGCLPSDYRGWRNALYRKAWVVYAKRPFGGPQQVIEYLGRYTHKSAISNHRILEVDAQHVRFAYKDYRHAGQAREMTLGGGEFLRRWSLHILPPGFRRMRHYGILANFAKTKALAECRRALGVAAAEPKSRRELRLLAKQAIVQKRQLDCCPCCGKGRWVKAGLIPPQDRAPPAGQMPTWMPIVA